MISGASQADIGVLVISARKGEFETGYEKGGQTREHILLAKTLGVAKLIVVINKMDEPTVQWSKERYDEIEGKMVPFLKSSGYNVKKDVQFMPISGLCGANMKTRMDKSICSWWDGPCLFEVLDRIEVPLRDPDGPVRMPIIDKYKDMGTVVMGKLESGTIREGDGLLVMPNKSSVKVIGISLDEKKVRCAGPGENVRVKLSGIEEDEIMAGFVLSSIDDGVEFDCECGQYQLMGILCCHVLKVIRVLANEGDPSKAHYEAMDKRCKRHDQLKKRSFTYRHSALYVQAMGLLRLGDASVEAYEKLPASFRVLMVTMASYNEARDGLGLEDLPTEQTSSGKEQSAEMSFDGISFCWRVGRSKGSDKEPWTRESNQQQGQDLCVNRYFF